MLVSQRGGFGEEHPWQTEGGGVTEHVLDALRIQYMTLDEPGHVATRVRQAVALSEASLRPVRCGCWRWWSEIAAAAAGRLLFPAHRSYSFLL